MLRSVSWAALCAFCVLSAVTFLPAVEPDGYLRIRPGWLQDPGGGDEGSLQDGKILRLSLESITPLSGAVLTVTLPETIRIEPLTERWRGTFLHVDAGEGRQAIQVSLEQLRPGAVLLLDFELSAAADESGIASFRIEAVSASGRTVNEAAGITLGHPGVRPVRRHGAMEFPAVIIPEERP
jgi:hypothetical protein